MQESARISISKKENVYSGSSVGKMGRLREISPIVLGSDPSEPATVSLGQLLPFSEHFDAVIAPDKIGSFFYQLLNFIWSFCCFADEIVVPFLELTS